jgi:hypothetical protein
MGQVDSCNVQISLEHGDKMLNETTIRKKFAKTASGAVCLALALAFLAVPGISSAGSFTFDGINTPNPGGDMYTESFEAEWFNGHKTSESNYQPGGGQMTTVLYGTGTQVGDNSGDMFSWLFLEVPIYAKTMTWGAGGSLTFDKATHSEKVVFGTDPGTSLTVAKIDGKTAGKSGKKSGKKVGKSGKKSGKKAGKSGKNGSVFGAATELDLDGDWKSDAGVPWKVLGFMDSVDYLLGTAAGNAECGFAVPATNCGASNRTMSFEVKLGLLNGGFTALRDAIVNNGLGFHLSPEFAGDPPSVIPVPAAFWLFGTALIGFIGFSRRTILG